MSSLVRGGVVGVPVFAAAVGFDWWTSGSPPWPDLAIRAALYGAAIVATILATRRSPRSGSSAVSGVVTDSTEPMQAILDEAATPVAIRGGRTEPMPALRRVMESAPASAPIPRLLSSIAEREPVVLVAIADNRLRARAHQLLDGLAELHVAADIDTALDVLRRANPDVVVVDEGVRDLVRRTKREPVTAGIEVLIISDRELDTADDRLPTDFRDRELIARIEARIEVRRLREQLARVTEVDALTELMSRTPFLREAEREMSRCVRSRSPMSFLMVDIDELGALNHEHGVALGDRVIGFVADAVRESIREHDLACRYGGEEFGVVLGDTDLEAAMQIAERLRARVEALEITEHGRPIGVSVSIGVSTRSASIEELDQLVFEADRALQRAKRGGRNRVKVSQAH